MREILPPSPPSKGLRFLYRSPFGAPILKLLTCRWVSRVAGRFLDSRLSKGMIKRYIRKNNVDMSLYEDAPYPCFNAFFTRRIRAELRPIDQTPSAFISPCDGKLTVFPVDGDSPSARTSIGLPSTASSSWSTSNEVVSNSGVRTSNPASPRRSTT